jgi:uracil phosphoribosyltransferase
MSPSAAPSSPIAAADLDSKPSAKVLKEPPSSLSLEENPKIHRSSHPLLFHKITALRSSKTPPGTFRSLLRQVTYHLGYEATCDLQTKSGFPVTVPLGKESNPDQEELRSSEDCGVKIVDRVALVPILRSGLGMTDAMLELLPNSAVHHIGMYRTPGIHVAPVQYFNRLPRGKCGSDVAYVLDPIVGSAATVMAVVSILKKVRAFLRGMREWLECEFLVVAFSVFVGVGVGVVVPPRLERTRGEIGADTFLCLTGVFFFFFFGIEIASVAAILSQWIRPFLDLPLTRNIAILFQSPRVGQNQQQFVSVTLWNFAIFSRFYFNDGAFRGLSPKPNNTLGQRFFVS